jgi:hypothetical protein
LRRRKKTPKLSVRRGFAAAAQVGWRLGLEEKKKSKGVNTSNQQQMNKQAQKFNKASYLMKVQG